jgi:uncharacterized protein (TIGR03382 family)
MATGLTVHDATSGGTRDARPSDRKEDTMRRNICGGVLMMMFLVPATVAAESAPGRWQNNDARITEQMHEPYWATCSTGDPGSLVIAAAAVGLLLRRRR